MMMCLKSWKENTKNGRQENKLFLVSSSTIGRSIRKIQPTRYFTPRILFSQHKKNMRLTYTTPTENGKIRFPFTGVTSILQLELSCTSIRNATKKRSYF